MSDNKKHKLPKKSKGDAFHKLAKIGLGSVPIVGAAASELLNAIVSPPLEKRRNVWFEEIGKALRELEKKMDFVLDSLQMDDLFIDTVIEATRIAIKTSNEEKREKLKNVILNSALSNGLEESLQNMFLSFIDTFTVWHLKILDLVDNPQVHIQKHSLNSNSNQIFTYISQIIKFVFPELEGKRTFYDLIWKDLYARSLVNSDSMGGMTTGSIAFQSHTTDLGKQFLNFIKNPIKSS